MGKNCDRSIQEYRIAPRHSSGTVFQLDPEIIVMEFGKVYFQMGDFMVFTAWTLHVFDILTMSAGSAHDGDRRYDRGEIC